ncbi:hypothetical protein [uncultured Bradyrhizobium sp.]|uniref:hypothetical protein n=1 Tax=uncultured Bradyrhizobium sp. TaxID=199684 RepID=UPI002637584C|nr:hypothetical protein [uncultured Bradyrhizobium sp.]
MFALFPGLIDLFHIPTLILAWAFTLALTAGPLLLKFLNDEPVTRCAVLQAVASFITTGCWLAFGSAAINAYERGLVSLPMSILAVACMFAAGAGSSFLIERRCSDQQAGAQSLHESDKI